MSSDEEESVDGSTHGIVALLRKFGRCSSVLNSNEGHIIDRVVEVTKAFCRRRFDDVVRGAMGRPLRYDIQADGTPVKLTADECHKIGSDRFRRRGTMCLEFLLMRCFIAYVDLIGNTVAATLAGEPVHCPRKFTWIAYGACEQFLPNLRELGHEGIIVYFACLDGGLFSSLGRRLKQLHESWYSSKPNCIKYQRMQNRDWEVLTLCGIHVAGNGLKWSCYAILANIRANMKTLYGVVASLRDSREYIRLKFLDLCSCIQYHSHNHDWTLVHAFWSSLGLPPSVVEELTELDLYFHEGVLYVCKSAGTDLKILGARVYTCLCVILQVREGTDSRWQSIGFMCRLLVTLWTLGLGYVVELLLKDDVGVYYISAYQNLLLVHKEFACFTCLVSHVSDSLIFDLLDDDRALRFLDQYWENMQGEIAWLSALPDYVWERITGNCVEIVADFSTFRSQCLYKAHKCCAYIEDRFFRPLRNPPFHLLKGDIDQNLLDLKNSPAHWERTTLRIQRCVQDRMPIAEARSGLEIILDGSLSSKRIEQDHGGDARMARAHKGMGQTMYQKRGYCHAVVPLLSPAIDDRYTARLKKLLADLRTKKPQRQGGQHIYMRQKSVGWDLVDVPSTSTPVAARRQFFGSISASYSEVSDQSKRSYDLQAQLDIGQKQKEIAEHIEHLTHALQLSEARRETEKKMFGTLSCLKSVHFSEHDLANLQEFYDDNKSMSPADVKRLRIQADSVAISPEYDRQVELVRYVQQRPEPWRISCPEWLFPVLRKRAWMYHCCLRIKRPASNKEDLDVLWLVACLSPFQASMLRLVPKSVMPCWPPGVRSERSIRTGFCHNWEVDCSGYVHDDELHLAAGDSIHVIPHVHLGANMIAFADLDPIPLEEFMRTLPEETGVRNSGCKRASRDEDIRDAPEPHKRKRCGWREEAQARIAGAQPSGPELEVVESAGETPIQPEDLDDDALEAVEAQIRADRARLELETKYITCPNFRTTTRSGKGTYKRTGLATDSTRAYSSGALARQFCSLYRLQETVTFALSHDRAAVITMCGLWCCKMQHLFDVWVIHDANPKFKFTRADVDSFEEPLDVSHLLEGNLEESTRRRIQEIRAMEPHGIQG